MSEENLYQITGTVRIKKGQGRSLKSGGAWIYDNEIDAVTDGFVNGGLVRVEDLIPEGEYRYDGMFTYTEVHGRGQYRVGDPIRVQCAKAEVSSGNVDFKPVKK